MRPLDLSYFLNALHGTRRTRSHKTTCDRCGRTNLKETWAIRRRDGSVAHLGSECAKKARRQTSDGATDRGPMRLDGLKLVPAKIVLKIDHTKKPFTFPHPYPSEKAWGIYWLVAHPTGELAYNPEEFSNYMFKEVSAKDAQHPVLRRIRSDIVDRLDKRDPNYKSLANAIGRDGAAFAVLPHKERGRYVGSSERLASELTTEFVHNISDGEREHVTSVGKKQIRARTSPLPTDRAYWAPNWISFSLKERHLIEIPPVSHDEAVALAAKMVDQLRAMGMYAKLDAAAHVQTRLILDKRMEQREFWKRKVEAGFIPDRPINPLLVAWTDPELARKSLESSWGGKVPTYAKPFIIGGVPVEPWAALSDIEGFHVIPGGEANVGFLVVGPLKPGWTWKDYVTQGLWLTEPETYDKQKSRPLTIADVKELGYTPDPSDIDKGTSSIVKLKNEKGKLQVYEVVQPNDVWGTYKSDSQRKRGTSNGSSRSPSDRAISKELRSRLGQCFSLAAKYVTRDSGGDSELVHGSIQAYGNPRIDHAWVEEGTAVYDAVLDKWMRRRDYYKQFGAKPEKRYTQDQVFNKLLTQRHWGPWE